MERSEFDYDLPQDRIAQYPPRTRSASRLLCLGGRDGVPRDAVFSDLPGLLDAGDLLVFNDTRVIPARLFGAKESGGKIEFLVERITGPDVALGHLRASKSPRTGVRIRFAGGAAAVVEGREDDLFLLRFDRGCRVRELLEQHGRMPLPPYIDRPDEDADRSRYQTLYARVPGAVAAPTAGLHFDQPVFDALELRGIETGFLTLHVGAGTFQPVRPGRLADHRMHREYVQVDAGLCARIGRTRAAGRRVIAVGTTVVRALETAARSGELRPFAGDTRLFITPGYRFRAADALLTNFHLPGSTLLMLVCAFGGYEPVMAAYQHAIDAGYRFYSYGDAMFLSRNEI